MRMAWGALLTVLILQMPVPAPAATDRLPCDQSDDAPVATVSDAPTLKAGSAFDLSVSRIKACLVQPAALDSPPWRSAAVVDVRIPSEVARAWMFGALTASPHLAALETAAGQHEALVLVGNGRNDADLVARCEVLRSALGKPVAVLQGGLPAWFTSGRPVQGDTAGFDAPMMLEVGEFAAHVSRRNAPVVFEAEPVEALTGSLLRHAVIAQPGERIDALVRRLAASATRPKLALLPAIVVVADASHATQWQQAFSDTGLREPIFYAGTAADLVRHVELASRIAEHRDKPLPGTCDRG